MRSVLSPFAAAIVSLYRVLDRFFKSTAKALRPIGQRRESRPDGGAGVAAPTTPAPPKTVQTGKPDDNQ